MSKKLVPIIAVIALFVCVCCVLSLAGGAFAAFSGESPAPSPPASPPASSSASSRDDDDDDADDDDDDAADDDAAADEPEGAKTCTRKVTATRTDSGNSSHGWGMDLRFKCNDTLVPIGRAMGGGPKSANVNFDGKGCPDEVNKTNWEGSDTYPDKFDVSVSDCVN